MHSGVQKHFPAGKRAGRLRVCSARGMINATFYVRAKDCQTTDHRWRAPLRYYPL